MNFKEYEQAQAGELAKEQEAQEVKEVQEPLTKEPIKIDPTDMLRVSVETAENGQKFVRIKPQEYDPALDPESPEFDKERLEEAQKQAKESIEASLAALNRMSAKLESASLYSFNAIGDALIETIQAETWQSLQKTLKALSHAFPLLKEIEELAPYLEAELQKKQYNGKSIDDLLIEAETDADGKPTETSLFMQALTAARSAREEASFTEEPLRTAIKRAEIIEYPLDKPNSIIWNLLEEDTKGQISFNMARYNSKQEIPAYYAINFDELGDDITITKRLLPFDKRVYIAVSALFNAGNKYITLSQIYYAMGYTGRPAAKHLSKINDAITKMTGARIFFDNEQEAEKYNYTRFKYDGSLLPFERGTAIVNGQLADAAIHIFREPPLITFAKQRKQITSINVKLLQSPINKTDANLLIDDYLIERISKAKNGKGHSCRILFKTLYAKTAITTKKQEQRAPDKIKRYLEHYQQEQFITQFTMEKDGITIHW